MKNKKLKNLSEHNDEKSKIWWDYRDNKKQPNNGIACPNCGKELVDTNPHITLTSMPPKKNIHCNECEYEGFRIV